MIQCQDGTLYTGITTDLERRLTEHNAGTGAKYTRPRRPVTLVYSEPCADRASASHREAMIKKLPRAQKLSLTQLHTQDHQHPADQNSIGAHQPNQRQRTCNGIGNQQHTKHHRK